MLRKPWHCLFVALLLFAFPTIAGEVRPNYLSPYIKSSAPKGTATLRKFFFKVYDGYFWTDSDWVDYSKPFALMVRYNMSIDGDKLVESTLSQMLLVSGKTPQDFFAFEEALMLAFPSVVSGDVITALYMPDHKVRFFFNGKLTSEVKSAFFAEHFFGIWFSDKTSEPDFRDALFGRMP